MTLFRTGEPEAEPVTLAGVKAHLRLDHDSEDGLLSGLIRAARDEVERATGTALIDRTAKPHCCRPPRTNSTRCRARRVSISTIDRCC